MFGRAFDVYMVVFFIFVVVFCGKKGVRFQGRRNIYI